jgi:hypothetical protein
MIETIDLGSLDSAEYLHCYTPQQVTQQAHQWADTNLPAGAHREVAAYLLAKAKHLTALSCRLTIAYEEDRWDNTVPDHGLSDAERNGLIVMAGTCAQNAALFIAEARRRGYSRVPHWDPITTRFGN